MKKNIFPRIGMRKIKSILALFLSFLIWQIVRIPYPEFAVHPLFGYVYAIIEMRESAEKTKMFGLRRIKATFIGLAFGLVLLPLSVRFGAYAGEGFLYMLNDIVIIMVGVVIALSVAQMLKCQNFCGIAAIVFVICIIRDRNTDINIYLYATLRALQTLLGVFSAWIVNTYICKYPKEEK